MSERFNTFDANIDMGGSVAFLDNYILIPDWPEDLRKSDAQWAWRFVRAKLVDDQKPSSNNARAAIAYLRELASRKYNSALEHSIKLLEEATAPIA